MTVRGKIACLLLAACAASALLAGEESTREPLNLRVYHDEMATDLFGRILYSYDAAPEPDVTITIPLNSLTTQGYATAADFAAATTWDFTPVAGLAPAGEIVDAVVFRTVCTALWCRRLH